MLASLRVRFLLALMGVVLVAVGTQAAPVSQSSAREFNRYLDMNAARDQMVATTLLSAPLNTGDAEQMQAMLKKLAGDADGRFVAADSTGVVIADSGDMLVGQSLVAPAPGD